MAFSALRFFILAAVVLLPVSSTVRAGESGMQDGGHRRGMMGGHMENAAVELPGIAADQLPDAGGEGARLLLRYCAQCHNLPSPATHSSKEWPEVLIRMDGYMKAGEGKGHREMMRIKRPTDSERRTIEDYLKKNGLQPFAGETLPDTQSEGGRLFQEICSGCHVLPDIRLHSPGEWPAIVERMRMNMRILGKKGISDGERDRISEYLRDHAPR